MLCQGIIPRKDLCIRQVPGHGGYIGAPHIEAIVLHPIVGISLEAYEAQIQTSLPPFALKQEHINPLSVHFIVTDTGAIQYVELSNSTYGIDTLDGNYPIGNLIPITNINGPWIHIGILGDCLLTNQLINLICCISLTLQKPLPVIAGSDLQKTRPELIIPASLQEQVNDCYVNGGLPEPPTIYEIEERIKALERCCIENKTAIGQLKNRVRTLENKVSALENTVQGIQITIETILNTIAILPTLQQQIELLTDLVNQTLTRCCPEVPDQTCFKYQLLPGQEMLITPNQPVWLNLPTRIEDAEPPLVTPGPLWKANLQGDCNWRLDAVVRFRLAQWCAGKKAKLFLVACGQNYLIAEQSITTTGIQSITLLGSFLLPPGCNDVHLLVSINDDVAKIVEFAEFKGCPIC